MELLDDTIPGEIKLSKERVKQKLKLKQDHKKYLGKINNARIALGIVFILSAISMIFNMRDLSSSSLEFGIILAVVVIFGICAATPPKFARFSLTVALIIYSLNLAAALINPSILIVIILIVKGVIIYFIAVGINAAFKFSKVLEEMERFNISPYNY